MKLRSYFRIMYAIFVMITSTALAQAPTIFNIMPVTGNAGQKVTITGTNLGSVTSVSFGLKAATTFRIVSATTIEAVIPSGLVKGPAIVETPFGSAASSQVFSTNLYRLGADGTEGELLTASGLSFHDVTAGKVHEITRIGDIDGDGADEIAVSLPDFNNKRGAVMIVYPSYNDDGEMVLKRTRRITPSTAGMTGAVIAGDGFGTAVAPLGDVDLDGVPDLAISALQIDTSYYFDNGFGSFWVLFMNRDGSIKTSRMTTQASLGLTNMIGFGHSIETIGDLDGNGVPELAVSAFLENGSKGNVYILFMDRSGTVIRKTSVATGLSLRSDQFFGFFIAASRDINGDGIDDLLVGSIGDGYDLGDNGSVTVIFLNSNGGVTGSHEITLQNGRFPSPNELSGLGWAFSTGQDMNMDGIPDLLASTTNDLNSSRPAEIYGLLLNRDGSVLDNKLLFTTHSPDFMLDPFEFYGTLVPDGTPYVVYGDYFESSPRLYYFSLGMVTPFQMSSEDGTWDTTPTNSFLDSIPTYAPIAFPATTVGNSVTRTFYAFINSVDPADALELESISTTGEFDLLTTSFSGMTGMQPGELFPVEVSFRAPAKGSYQGTMEVLCGDFRLFPHVFQMTATVINSSPSSISLSPMALDENAANLYVGRLTTTDPDIADTHAYALAPGVGSEDNGLFRLENDELIILQSPDFETKNSYNVRIRTTDNDGGVLEQTFTISVRDMNEAPIDILLSNTSINEGNTLGMVIGNITARDADSGDSFAYELSGTEPDNSFFSIEGAQLVASIVTDFENRKTYSIRIRVTDRGGLTFDKPFIITVSDMNETPEVENLSVTVDENTGNGTIITTVNAADPEGQPLQFEITSGNVNNAFSIDPLTGQIAVMNQPVIDFEALPLFLLTITVTDPGNLSATSSVEIRVNDINEPPAGILLSNSSINENTAAPGVVGMLNGADPDQQETFSFGLVPGAGDRDNDAFQIVDNELVMIEAPDFETQDTYLVRVRVVDKGGLTFEQAFVVNVLDVNEPPVVVDATVSIDENSPVHTALATMTAIDQEGAVLRYSIESGNIGNGFTIDPATGQVTVANSDALDFETRTRFSLVIVAIDPLGLAGFGKLEISINDVNEQPSDILLDNTSFAESSPPLTTIGRLTAVDVDRNDTHAYALVSGEGDEDNDLFTIANNDLATASYFNYEVRTNYSIRVQVTDAAGNTFEKFFKLTVTDFNENLLLFIPTLFSPNGDGANDSFLVRSDEIADVVFSVYSPTLGVVYNTRDVAQATAVGWDGTLDGKPLLPGVYIWKISGHFRDGQSISFNGAQAGTVVLVR